MLAETEEDAVGGQSENMKYKPFWVEYARAAVWSEILRQTSQRMVDGCIAIKEEMYGEKIQEYVKARNADKKVEEESQLYADKTASHAELYAAMQMSPD